MKKQEEIKKKTAQLTLRHFYIYFKAEDIDFELTEDQKKVIFEIKKDMESTRPMDRLLCGDVGYGKTEVAFVAAFKAILDSKQVLFLCPLPAVCLTAAMTDISERPFICLLASLLVESVSSSHMMS